MRYSVKDLVEHLEAKGCSTELIGNEELIIDGLATLVRAGQSDLTFLANPRYRSELPGSRAGACLISEDEKDLEGFAGARLVCSDPYLAYSYLSHLFSSKNRIEQGIHRSAVIDSSAKVAESVSIGPNVVIEADTVIGEEVFIGANTVVGKGSSIGGQSRLYSNVTLYEDVTLGERVTIHSGSVLGSDGFGYANCQGKWSKIAQLGGVRVGDDVEIGASTTIDSGALESTIIGNGVIIDNQVQIAHNVVIGDHTAIAGCVGIAGSTKIGKYCTIAGAAGLAGHLVICDSVHIAMQAQVTKSINLPGSYSSGTGLLPTREWRKAAVYFRQLERWVKGKKSEVRE